MVGKIYRKKGGGDPRFYGKIKGVNLAMGTQGRWRFNLKAG